MSIQTLEKWRAAALLQPAGKKQWTPAARFEALLATVSLNEQECSAWCRTHGVYPLQFIEWRQSATEALGAPQTERSNSAQAKADRRRIQELERDLRRKEKALAETAALPVLSKKLEAIFPRDEDE